MAKKGLGKGIDALFSDIEDEEIGNTSSDVSRETMVDINCIDPNKDQPRRNFDEDALNELADSIKQYGIIQPIIVQKRNNNRYEIIAGERRWRAARLAHLAEVPVVVKEYTEAELVAISLIENIQREDLNPIEEAQAYQRLINDFNLTQDAVAEKVSKSRTALTNSMRLLKLDERVKQMLIDEMLTEGHGRALLAIEDKELQYLAAQKVFDEKMSVRETEKYVKKFSNKESDESGKKDKTKTNESLAYGEIEEKLKNYFGTKVAIHQKANNKGKLEIEYYSSEDLERIIDLLWREK